MSYNAKKFDDKIITILQNGGVGVLPTDTIYGLSTVALNERAVEKIHKLKGRDSSKPLIVLIANTAQLSELGLDEKHSEPVKEYWPGPLSLEFDASNAPLWLHRKSSFFAVRLPKDEKLCRLIEKIGPLVSTSANLQGQEPAKSIKEAKKYFGDRLDFYIDVGELEGQSSTLVKLEDGQLKVIRPGALNI